jgi:hypothetical protein
VTKKDNRIRVLLADDHTMFRQRLKEMLATGEDIEVVGEAENGEEAVASRGRALRAGTGDPARRSPRPLQPSDSSLALYLGGDGQAPPR